jgi:hypothetical protein
VRLRVPVVHLVPQLIIEDNSQRGNAQDADKTRGSPQKLRRRANAAQFGEAGWT